MLKMTDIHKSFGELEVLKGIDFSVAKGDVLAIIGPSGSGKSTMLRCINRLEEIDSGKIEIMGRALAENGADGTISIFKVAARSARLISSSVIVSGSSKYLTINSSSNSAIVSSILSRYC